MRSKTKLTPEDKTFNALKREPILETVSAISRIYRDHIWNKPDRVRLPLEYLESLGYEPGEFAKYAGPELINLESDLRKALGEELPEEESWAEALSRKNVAQAVLAGKRSGKKFA